MRTTPKPSFASRQRPIICLYRFLEHVERQRHARKQHDLAEREQRKILLLVCHGSLLEYEAQQAVGVDDVHAVFIGSHQTARLQQRQRTL